MVLWALALRWPNFACCHFCEVCLEGVSDSIRQRGPAPKLLDREGSRTPRMMEQLVYELWDTPIGAAFKASRSSVCAPAVSSPARPAGSEEGSPLQRSAHREIDRWREPRNSGAHESGRFPAAIPAQFAK